jgi:hypothetical protein
MPSRICADGTRHAQQKSDQIGRGPLLWRVSWVVASLAAERGLGQPPLTPVVDALVEG